jgi:glucosamine-phosphate N-acetyltransferase
MSEKVLADLPAGYTMRPLCRSDYHRGYMDVLRVVGRTGWVGEDIWDERCEWLRSQSSTYYILVVVNEQDKVIATGTCMMERKFIHNMGVVGHIEDLAVARDQKGKKMGLRVLEALVHVATCHGCYKVRAL